MSTRAILGIKNPDGTITGAWQWNNGDGLITRLNKHFNTMEKALVLIKEGMWSTIYTEDEKQDYEDWLINDLYKGREAQVPHRSYVPVFGIYLLKDEHHENRGPETYSDFHDASGQDINHIYLFNPVTNKWVKDKDIRQE